MAEWQNFPQDFTEKAIPVADDLLLLWDSADLDTSGNPKSDKKTKLSYLWAAIFWARDTASIPEGTNLYYTDARVTTSTNAAFSLRELLSNKSTNIALWASDTLYPTQKAVRDYVNNFWVTINAQTEETVMADTDEIIFYDVSSWWSKKIQSQNLSNVNIWAWTTYIAWEANTSRTTSALTKLKEIECRGAWTYTVSYQASANVDWWSGVERTNESQIYKNGVAFGALNTNISQLSTPTTYSESLTFAYGDLIQLYAEYTWTVSYTAQVSNFSVKYDLVSFKYYTWTTNLD